MKFNFRKLVEKKAKAKPSKHLSPPFSLSVSLCLLAPPWEATMCCVAATPVAVWQQHFDIVARLLQFMRVINFTNGLQVGVAKGGRAGRRGVGEWGRNKFMQFRICQVSLGVCV